MDITNVLNSLIKDASDYGHSYIFVDINYAKQLVDYIKTLEKRK